MVFKDVDSKLYHALLDEYYSQIGTLQMIWDDFIKHKDLGIELAGDHVQWDTYIITNPQKWMICRLRYGV